VLQVSSGGSASGVVVQGGIETVFGHGAASGTVVSGGYEYDFGLASATVVRSGGHEIVGAGGRTSGSVISAGGREVVSAGGVAAATTVSSGGVLLVSSGGSIAGGLTIADGGLATLSGKMTAGQTVSFTDAAGELQLFNLAGFNAKIAGMSGPGQKVDLGGFAFSSGETVTWTQAGTSGTLTVSDGAKVANLTLIGTYVTSDFALAGDGHGGTFVSDPPAPSANAATFVAAAASFHGGRYEGVESVNSGLAQTSPPPLAATAISGR
jgi:autotransporter passenger strand-loop-strand repeat protein